MRNHLPFMAYIPKASLLRTSFTDFPKYSMVDMVLFNINLPFITLGLKFVYWESVCKPYQNVSIFIIDCVFCLITLNNWVNSPKNRSYYKFPIWICFHLCNFQDFIDSIIFKLWCRQYCVLIYTLSLHYFAKTTCWTSWFLNFYYFIFKLILLIFI